MTETTATTAKAKKAETAIETVTMTDGRIVEFAGKRKLLKTGKVSAEGVASVVLDFRNGETRTFTVPAGLVAKFAVHGAEQKLGDEIAGLEDIEDCVLAVDELVDRLYNGEWVVKREANGMAGTSVLARALLELYPTKTRDDIKAFLGKQTQAGKNALRESAKLKPIVARIEAEKATKAPKVDTDALLAGLDAPAEAPAA